MNLLRTLRLPQQVTPFEASYLARANRVALWLLVLHVPVFMGVAAVHGTGVVNALVLTTLVLLGPALGSRFLSHPRHRSKVIGVASMCMGGLLVHFGQGPMQIEMHFYFFVLLALLVVFANPMVIVVSALTVTVHHLLLFWLLPSSIFNYDATFWTVLVHAFFVALESAAAIFVARTFFDNVVHLEHIVAERTRELAERSNAMRQVLDHVAEGLASIDAEGRLAPDRSAFFDSCFGTDEHHETLFDAFASRDPAFAAASRVGWMEVAEGTMPKELTLAQMPRRLLLGARTLEVQYEVMGDADPVTRALVVIRDVTDAMAREAAVRANAEAAEVLDRARGDIDGFVALLATGEAVLDACGDTSLEQRPAQLRALHTLKGNAAMYGLESVAELCHRIEDLIAATGDAAPSSLIAELRERWHGATRLGRVIVERNLGTVELTPKTFALIEGALLGRHHLADALIHLRAARLVPTRVKLEQFSTHAQRIARDLGKEITVEIEDRGVLLDPVEWGELWLVLIHPIRNAIDHGIEDPTTRLASGKNRAGRLALRTGLEAHDLLIEIADDGRGIDFEALRRKAASRGLTDLSDDRLLFCDGLSTASAVTEVSGRGVGMGALVDLTERRGGIIEVESRAGHGSLLRLRLPIGPSRRERLASKPQEPEPASASR